MNFTKKEDVNKTYLTKSLFVGKFSKSNENLILFYKLHLSNWKKKWLGTNKLKM